MKFTYKVTIDVDDSTPCTKAQVAHMVRSDIGSWEGSLPVEERLYVKKVTVVHFKEDENGN